MLKYTLLFCFNYLSVLLSVLLCLIHTCSQLIEHISSLCPSWVMCLMMQPVFELSCLFVCVCVCVYSWPSPGHQPGEEQAVPGRRGRLLGGGESAGPAGWLPGGQRQQPQYAGSPGSTGEGWAPPAAAYGGAFRMFTKVTKTQWNTYFSSHL